MSDLTSALRPIVILEYLAGCPDGATLREIRDQLALPRSSVWLLVRQLEEGGFVKRDAAGRFTAGARLVQMGLALYQSATVAGDSRILLQNLAVTTGLDVYLGIRTGDSVVYSDRMFGAKSVQIRRQLGEPRSLHASAPGKLFLAYETDGLWERCIAGRKLERLTERTVTDHRELKAQLQRARELGYLEISSEVLMSIASIGAMAFNPDGSPWAVVMVSGHESDLVPKRDEVIEQVLATTRELTRGRAALESADRRRPDGAG
jgi:IclR family transcriptional regulator, acetate operon repressor